MKKLEKNLDYYNRLAYDTHFSEVRDENGDRYFTAEFQLLPGCKADGQTHVEAYSNLREVFECYILACLKMGADIAEPVTEKPTSLQYELPVEQKNFVIYIVENKVVPDDQKIIQANLEMIDQILNPSGSSNMNSEEGILTGELVGC